MTKTLSEALGETPFDDPCEVCKHHVGTARDQHPCNDCKHMMNDHWEYREAPE